uniref:Uncharacterized protein n=1 Tax=Solanum lycopersicum TaxID=4081 RepID=A0A3Q7GKE7_SOLLC
MSQPTNNNIHKSQHKREEKLRNITKKKTQVTPAAITDDQELRQLKWGVQSDLMVSILKDCISTTNYKILEDQRECKVQNNI